MAIDITSQDTAKDVAKPRRPHADDDLVNAKLYSVAQEIDRILLRHPMEDHAAVMGLIQVTIQRRSHDHQQRQQKKQEEAMAEIQRRRQFMGK